MWPFTVGKDFCLGNSLLGAVKLTTNADPDKYKYFGYGIGFDASESFLLSNGSGFSKNVIILGFNMIILWVQRCILIIREKILILCKGSMQRLDNTTLIAEKEFSINFTEEQKKFCLSLHYNRVNSYIFVNVVEI